MDPVHIDDVVVIYDYDSEWPRLFEEERDRLEPVISAFAVSIEHVGSTAVPDLCSKPIVDLLVTVERLEPSDHYSAALAPFGYVLRADTASSSTGWQESMEPTGMATPMPRAPSSALSSPIAGNDRA